MARNETICLLTTARALKGRVLLFATRLAMVKQVPGEEFETNNRMVAATKLQDEDSVVFVTMINGETDIVLQTTGGNFLRSIR